MKKILNSNNSIVKVVKKPGHNSPGLEKIS